VASLSGLLVQKCRICQGDATPVFRVKYGKTPLVAGQPVELDEQPWIYRCCDCGFRFTEPLLKPWCLEAAYAASDTMVWKDDPRNAWRRGYMHRVGILSGSAPQKVILDVGCYTGEFLHCFPGDWQKIGVEPSAQAASAARERGIEIAGVDIFSPSLKRGSFGVVSAMNVIEHVPDPVSFIQRARYLLADNGVLFIETGDADSVFARLMGRFWSYYSIAEHISFFTKQGLINLFLNQNFDLLVEETGFFHKRPLGSRAWARHVVKLSHAIGYRFAQSPVSYFSNDRSPLSVPWVTHMDHMYVMGQKKPILAN